MTNDDYSFMNATNYNKLNKLIRSYDSNRKYLPLDPLDPDFHLVLMEYPDS